MPPILFQNADFVVLNKPPGLPVHAGPRGGPSVEDWFPALSRRRAGPWLVHRLDADTSGCLLVALRRAALQAAQAVWAEGVRKTYWAVVRGGPDADAGMVDAPLAKRSRPGKWWMEVDPAGAPARTAWQVMGRAGGLAWLALRPLTGRTHQIRVHCATLGCPLVGDPIYGDGIGTLHLLARALEVPVDPGVWASAPPPGHMIGALTALGWSGAEEPPAEQGGLGRGLPAQAR